jgi:hypothetical protein
MTPYNFFNDDDFQCWNDAKKQYLRQWLHQYDFTHFIVLDYLGKNKMHHPPGFIKRRLRHWAFTLGRIAKIQIGFFATFTLIPFPHVQALTVSSSHNGKTLDDINQHKWNQINKSWHGKVFPEPMRNHDASINYITNRKNLPPNMGAVLTPYNPSTIKKFLKTDIAA